MKKKLILSLLMSVPVTQAALASIALNSLSKPTGWSAEGITGDNYVVDEETNSVSCAIGTGVLSQTVKDLPKGDYVITFGETNNVTVSVNRVTIEAKDNKYSFSLEKQSDAIIVITATDLAKEFSFTSPLLSFDKNFLDAANALNDKFNEIPNFTTIKDNVAEDVKATLAKEKTTIESNKNEIDKLIEGIAVLDIEGPANSITVDKLIKLYDEYDVENDFKKIYEDISTCSDNVTKWNEKAARANDVAGLLDQVNALKTQVGELINSISNGEYEGKDNDLNDARILQSEIYDFYTEVENYFNTELTDEKKKELEEKISEFEEKLTTSKVSVDNKVADVEMNNLLGQLKEVYDEAIKSIETLAGVDGYTDVYKDKKQEWKDQIQAEYDAVLEFYNEQTEEKASSEVLEPVKLVINQGIEEIGSIVTNATELVDAQNKAFEDALKEIEGTYEAKSTKFDKWQAPTQFNDEFNDLVDALHNAYDALEQYAIDLYKGQKYGTDDDPFTGDIVVLDYEDLVDKFNDAYNKLENQTKNWQPILDLQSALEEAQKDIETSYEELKNTEGFKLLDNLDPSYEQINQAILDIEFDENGKIAEGEEDKIEALIESYTATADNLITLFKALKEAEKAVETAFSESDIPTDLIDVPAKMQKTYDNILESINSIAIEDCVCNADQVTKVQEAIDNLTVTADKLIDIFGSTYNQLTQFQEALGSYKTFVENKVVVLESVTDKMPLSGYNTFKSDVQKYLDDLHAAAGKEGEDIYTDAVAVNEAFAKKYGKTEGEDIVWTWSVQLDEAKTKFAKAVTDANEKAVEDEIASVEKKLPEVVTSVNLEKVKESFQAISETISSTETNVDTWAGCDVDLEAMANSLQALEPMLNYFDKIQLGIGNLLKQNQTETPDGGAGYDYFEGVIADIQTDFDNTTDEIVDALNENKLNADLKSKLEEIFAKIGKTGNDITANNANYASQSSEYKSVKELLETVSETINRTDENPYLGTDSLASWNEQLGKLNGDLEANKEAMETAYGSGKSKEESDKLNDEYSRIKKDANDILGLFNGEYAQAVQTANNKFIQDNWTNLIDGLYQQYLNSINAYNDYIYGDFANEDYQTAVVNGYKTLPGIETHVTLYDYAALITDLKTKAEQVHQNASKNEIILDKDNFKQEGSDETFIAIANSYKKGMQDNVDGMNAEANAIAEAFYNLEHGKAVNAIQSSKQQMAGQGISDENIATALEDANSDLKEAESRYTSSKKGENGYKTLGLEMDNILTYLKKVEPSIDVEKAAKGQWEESYEAASEQITTLRKDLNKYADDVPEGKQEAFNALQEEFEEIADQVKALNDNAKSETSLIDNLKTDYLDPLKDYMEDLNNLVQKGKTQDEMEAAVLDFETQLEALKDYVDGFPFDGSKFVDPVAEEIESLKTLVNGPGAISEAADLESKKEAIEQAIADAYDNAAKASLEMLSSWLPKLKIAFNDASAKADFSAEELEKLNETIDGYTLSVGELYGTFTYDDRMKFQENANKLLEEMTATYNTLQSKWTDSPKDEALDDLADLYDTINKAIENGKTMLNDYDESVAKEYEPQYDDAKVQLDALKGAWSEEAEADGALVIASQAKYESLLNALKATVDELDSAAANEHEKRSTSNTMYETLSQEWDDLNAEFERVKNEVDTYGLKDENFTNQLETIESLLNTSKADLEEKKEAFSLDGNSTLLDKEIIGDKITSVEYEANYRYNLINETAADDALKAVNDALDGSVMNFDELNGKYKDLYAEFEDLKDNTPGEKNISDENLQTLKEMVEKYQQIKAKAEELLNEVKENQYTLGDVNLNPDGQVNVIDVQMIVNWVGEGVTFNDLLEENPRQAYAADVTQNKQINIADVTAAVNLVMGETASSVYANQYRSQAIDGGNTYSLAFVCEIDGVQRYAVLLNNSNRLVAGQFDIKLDAGLSLVNVVSADRIDSHEMVVNEHFEGGARVVLFSLENAEILGNEGAIAYIDVRGEGNISVDEMLFADKNARAYSVENSNPSGINDSFLDKAKEVIYDAAGRVYNSIQRGLNIIRRSDGSVSKEIHK